MTSPDSLHHTFTFQGTSSRRLLATKASHVPKSGGQPEGGGGLRRGCRRPPARRGPPIPLRPQEAQGTRPGPGRQQDNAPPALAGRGEARPAPPLPHGPCPTATAASHPPALTLVERPRKLRAHIFLGRVTGGLQRHRHEERGVGGPRAAVPADRGGGGEGGGEGGSGGGSGGARAGGSGGPALAEDEPRTGREPQQRPRAPPHPHARAAAAARTSCVIAQRPPGRRACGALRCPALPFRRTAAGLRANRLASRAR